MGRPRNEPPPPPAASKCYVVRVDGADEQRALEALAEHQGRVDVGAWLLALGLAYVRRYLAPRVRA